jgi:RNA polymerase sigma-70 factor (ECF subfamily)
VSQKSVASRCPDFIKGKLAERESPMSWNQTRSRPSNAPFIEYLDRLYSYARILVRNAADAENLVQEACARSHEPMGEPQASDSKLRLFTVLRDLWLERQRDLRTKDQNDLGSDAVAFSGKSLESRGGEGEPLRAAIQDLPTELREIVFLREYEGLSPQEIASLVKCPVETVTPQLSRARGKLRAALAALNGPLSSQRKKQQEGPSGAGSLLFFSRTELAPRTVI